MTIATSTLMYLLYNYFEDSPSQNIIIDANKKLSARRQKHSDIVNAPVCFGMMTNQTMCLIGCMFLNVFVKGPMSCFETMGVEFAESHFNMEREQAGAIVATAGFLGAMNLIVLKISITQHYNDIQIMMIGYSMFIIGWSAHYLGRIRADKIV